MLVGILGNQLTMSMLLTSSGTSMQRILRLQRLSGPLMLTLLTNRLDFMLRGRSNPRGGVMSGDLLLPPIPFLILVSPVSSFPYFPLLYFIIWTYHGLIYIILHSPLVVTHLLFTCFHCYIVIPLCFPLFIPKGIVWHQG